MQPIAGRPIIIFPAARPPLRFWRCETRHASFAPCSASPTTQLFGVATIFDFSCFGFFIFDTISAFSRRIILYVISNSCSLTFLIPAAPRTASSDRTTRTHNTRASPHLLYVQTQLIDDTITHTKHDVPDRCCRLRGAGVCHPVPCALVR